MDVHVYVLLLLVEKARLFRGSSNCGDIKFVSVRDGGIKHFIGKHYLVLGNPVLYQDL